MWRRRWPARRCSIVAEAKRSTTATAPSTTPQATCQSWLPMSSAAPTKRKAHTSRFNRAQETGATRVRPAVRAQLTHRDIVATMLPVTYLTYIHTHTHTHIHAARDDVVGVHCKGPRSGADIRLHPPGSNRGRLEISFLNGPIPHRCWNGPCSYHKTVWGTVCRKKFDVSIVVANKLM